MMLYLLQAAGTFCLLFGLVLGQSRGGCTSGRYNIENRQYVNRLGDILKSVYNNLKLPQNHVEEYLWSIEAAFRSSFAEVSNCDYVGTPSSYDIITANQHLYQYLQTYRYDGEPVDQKVIDVVRQAEDLFTELGKYPLFASCYLTQVRDSVFEYIKGCVNGKPGSANNRDFKINTNANQLEPVPVESLENEQFRKNFAAFVNIFARGFLQVANCNSDEKIRLVVGGLSKHLWEKIDVLKDENPLIQYADICEATDAMQLCLCVFEGKCSDVMTCFQNLVDNFDTVGKQEVFSVGKAVIWGIECKLRGGESGAISSLIDAGKALFQEFKELLDEARVTKPGLVKQLGQIIKTIVKANFRIEACGCEHVPEIRESLAAC